MDINCRICDLRRQSQTGFGRAYHFGGIPAQFHVAKSRKPSPSALLKSIQACEKIGRWESNNWVWAEDPKYETSALRIAEGKKDRRKQDALYVRIGRDGRVCSTPRTISEDETRDEFERARRYRSFVDSVLDGKASSRRYDKAMAALKILFEGQRRTG